LKLLQLDLAAHPPPAPVKKITVEVFPARVRLTQAGLFQPLAPEPAKLEVTVARLRATVGEQDPTDNARVGFPLVMDAHRPDSFQVLPSSIEKTGNSAARETSPGKTGECLPAPQLVLRRFRPPLAARVEFSPSSPVCSGWGAIPVTIVFNGVKANGHREDWDLTLNINGASGLYRIFRDLQSGQWFVEGMYD
jgi:protein ImuB